MKSILLLFAGTVTLFTMFCHLFPGGTAHAEVQAPVLKWQRGGCFSSWCETGWYASPAVADLDGDGTMEVVAAAYRVVVINGETGALINYEDPDGGRSWPGRASCRRCGRRRQDRACRGGLRPAKNIDPALGGAASRF